MRIPIVGIMLREITNNVNRFLNTKMTKYDIRQGQFDYMVTIALNDGITMNQLATVHNVAKASVTKAVNVLIKKDFVRKETCEDDGRISRLYLTNEGESVMDNFLDYRDELESKLYGSIDDKEFEIFVKVLTKLSESSKEL